MILTPAGNGSGAGESPSEFNLGVGNYTEWVQKVHLTSECSRKKMVDAFTSLPGDFSRIRSGPDIALAHCTRSVGEEMLRAKHH